VKIYRRAQAKQQGVGLIEVLVTLLVLSTALLALAALQTRSLQFNHDAYLRSQANIFAYDMLDRMRLNVANLNDYNSALAAANLTSTPVTTPIAAADLDAWRRAIAVSLPEGKAGIACAADSVCTLTIAWYEQHGTQTSTEGTMTFTYSARL
jgi:type IV pilus assembly protein PilV